MKFTPLQEGYALKDPQSDYEQAEKLDKYRVSDNAIYAPAGFGNQEYLLLKNVTKAYYHDFQMRTGCCTGTWPKRGIVVCYGDNGILKIRPDKEKFAAPFLETLQKRIPGLDTEIPELYKNETRKGW